MNKHETQDALNTQTLGQAICDHFGLSKDRVASDYEITHAAGLMSLSLTVFLTAEDLAGIARKAGAKSMGLYPHQLVFFGDPGPELINVNTPSKLYDDTLQELRALAKPKPASEDAAFDKGAQQLTIKIDASEAAAMPKEAVAELHQALTLPSVPVELGQLDAISPDPWIGELLTEIKALRGSVEKFNQEALDSVRSTIKQASAWDADSLPPTRAAQD